MAKKDTFHKNLKLVKAKLPLSGGKFEEIEVLSTYSKGVIEMPYSVETSPQWPRKDAQKAVVKNADTDRIKDKYAGYESFIS